MREGRRRSAGVVMGLLVGTALLLALTQPIRVFGPPTDAVFLPFAGLVAVAVVAGISVVLALLAVLMRRIPLAVRALGTGAAIVVLATSVYVVGFGLASATGNLAGAIVVSVLAAAALLALMGVIGASLASLVSPEVTAPRRAVVAGHLVASIAVVIVAVLVLRAPGDASFVVAPVRSPAPPPLGLADPSAPGPFDVATLTYGSGLDLHRQAFAAGATILTSSVDASALWESWPRARSRYWGFDTTALPRNARVWYPIGEGPYPLVLIVHGNHPLSMWESADEGYAYLAEGLASRGYIVASIDQNFLDTAPQRYAAAPGETIVRAWHLLEHLRLWRRWQTLGDTPLGTSIDMSRIALVGHSRGGEAAALAASLNRLERFPDDARVRFAFGFDITSIVAIAPTDMEYEASGRRLPIEGVNYLALHGSNDHDVQGFQGSRAYARADVSGDDDLLKAAVYVDRANHGQWDRAWGAVDRTGWAEWLLNRAPLMRAEDQERVAQVFITSFLEATLGGEEAYRRVLRDHRHAWPWLPEVAYLTQYLDGTFVPLATFDDRIDPGRTSLPGGRIQGAGLAAWVEEDVDLRSPLFFGTGENRAVRLAWNAPEASYTIVLPDGLTLAEGAAWTFAFADPGETPPPAERAPAPEAATEDPTGEGTPADAPALAPEDAAGDAVDAVDAVDFTLELVWEDGRSAGLALSSVHAVQPPPTTRLTRIPLFDRPRAQTVFASVVVPFEAFAAAAEGRDLSAVRALRFRFDRQASGVVLLDDIGLLDQAPPESAP